MQQSVAHHCCTLCATHPVCGSLELKAKYAGLIVWPSVSINHLCLHTLRSTDSQHSVAHSFAESHCADSQFCQPSQSSSIVLSISCYAPECAQVQHSSPKLETCVRARVSTGSKMHTLVRAELVRRCLHLTFVHAASGPVPAVFIGF